MSIFLWIINRQKDSKIAVLNNIGRLAICELEPIKVLNVFTILVIEL